MKLIARGKELGGREFVIEEEKGIGYYLFVHEDGRCVRDHLQDSAEMAIDLALEEYAVPKDSWKPVA